MARSGRGAEARTVPAVDERLVMPGSGIEILDGAVLKVPGADPPHATHHLTLAYLLGAHVAPGFVGAVDMLTRTSLDSDFAPDASVYPEGRDPVTGGRKPEVLAFEVVATQRLEVATKKARELSARGVRRIFALVVTRRRVLEWSPGTAQFRPMHRDERIEDPSLAIALPVRALVETALADEAVLAALVARRPDLIEHIRAAAEAQGEARGEAAAARRALLRVCAASLVTVPDDARLGDATAGQLERLLEAVLTTRRWPNDRR